MRIDDGRATTEVEEGAPIRFHVSHAKGTNFFLVRSMQPEAAGTLTVIFQGAAYVMQLQSMAANPVASAIFKRGEADAAVKLSHAPEPVRFSPRVG